MTHPWPTGSCGRGGEACGDVTAPIPLIVRQGRDPNKDMDQLSRYHAIKVSRGSHDFLQNHLYMSEYQ